MTKIRKFSNFQRFYAFFSKFWTDFVNCNVEKGQRGPNVLSSMQRKEINAVFETKHSGIHIKKDNVSKTF